MIFVVFLPLRRLLLLIGPRKTNFNSLNFIFSASSCCSPRAPNCQFIISSEMNEIKFLSLGPNSSYIFDVFAVLSSTLASTLVAWPLWPTADNLKGTSEGVKGMEWKKLFKQSETTSAINQFSTQCNSGYIVKHFKSSIQFKMFVTFMPQSALGKTATEAISSRSCCIGEILSTEIVRRENKIEGRKSTREISTSS